VDCVCGRRPRLAPAGTPGHQQRRQDRSDSRFGGLAELVARQPTGCLRAWRTTPVDPGRRPGRQAYPAPGHDRRVADLGAEREDDRLCPVNDRCRCRGDIFVISPNGRNRRRITHEPPHVLFRRIFWSRNSRTVLYTRSLPSADIGGGRLGQRAGTSPDDLLRCLRATGLEVTGRRVPRTDVVASSHAR
jgi:hypothetical protein